MFKSIKSISNRIISEYLNEEYSFNSYKKLFSLFLKRFLLSAKPFYSLASYPGCPSCYGKFQEEIEGFTRFLPLITCWLAPGRSPLVTPAGDTQHVNVLEIAKQGILNATNPQSKGYYGDIKDNDSKIIAACQIAISLWLAKDTLWESFTYNDKLMISNWLIKVNKCKVMDNNWHLFIVMVNVVLKNLECNFNEEQLLTHYNRHKTFYIGNGFYSDGPDKHFDYYNAWEVQPFLILINAIDPNFDTNFIRETTGEFLNNFPYFFTNNGFPIFGRSICYRLALPCPLILGTYFNWRNIDLRTAASAFHKTWTHFIKKGAINKGLITSGYYKNNPSFFDDYSGPASSNWSLWALASSFLFPDDSEFWQKDSIKPLAVESNSFSIFLEKINLNIIGNKKLENVSLKFGNNLHKNVKNAKRFNSIVNLLINMFYNSGNISRLLYPMIPYKISKFLVRPENNSVKYDLPIYESDNPFCEFKN